MEKVTMFRTSCGLLYADESEALEAEKRSLGRHAFMQAYENCAIFADTAGGMVYGDTVLKWAEEHPEALRALVEAAAGGGQ